MNSSAWTLHFSFTWRVTIISSLHSTPLWYGGTWGNLPGAAKLVPEHQKITAWPRSLSPLWVSGVGIACLYGDRGLSCTEALAQSACVWTEIVLALVPQSIQQHGHLHRCWSGVAAGTGVSRQLVQRRACLIREYIYIKNVFPCLPYYPLQTAGNKLTICMMWCISVSSCKRQQTAWDSCMLPLVCKGG